MSKVLTILAPGACLREDIAKFGVVGKVMAVSAVIADYNGHIDYAVCVWDKTLDLWMQLRKCKNRNTEDVATYTRPLRCNIPINNSGLLALSLGHDLGYDEVRVLGMPVDATGHYYDIDAPGEKSLPYKFFYELKDEWETELKTWTNFSVASGNLLKYFKPLQQP